MHDLDKNQRSSLASGHGLIATTDKLPREDPKLLATLIHVLLVTSTGGRVHADRWDRSIVLETWISIQHAPLHLVFPSFPMLRIEECSYAIQ